MPVWLCHEDDWSLHLDDIAYLGNLFVAFDFLLRELSRGRVYTHPEVRFFISNGQIAFQIMRELQRFTILIFLAFLGIAIRAFFSAHHCSAAGLTDSTRRAITATPELMDNPLASNWHRIFELIHSMAALLSRLQKHEKVEWSGEGLLKDRPRNFLNDNLSFYPVEFNDHLTGEKPFLQQQAFEQEHPQFRLARVIHQFGNKNSD